jgi:hypothetical protein
MTDDPMFPPADAARAARDAVVRLAPSASHDERATARIARAALFQEALLGAIRAHVAELRTVTR